MSWPNDVLSESDVMMMMMMLMTMKVKIMVILVWNCYKNKGNCVHLSSHSKSEKTKQQDRNYSEVYAVRGDCDTARMSLF
jgi:hypothetical protein